MTVNHPSFGKLDDNQVIMFDTTLRDGEQSPGFSMTLEEKLRMAEALKELGVDVLEAGFAIASQGDFESVQAISQALRQGRAGDRQPVPRGAGGHPALARRRSGPRRGGASTSCWPPPTCTCGSSCG